jgi:PmbA protein
MIPYEIFYSNERCISLEWSGNALKVKEFSEAVGYGIRVIKNRRVGFAYTENSKKIDDAIKNACEMARFSPVSNFSFQPPTRYEKVETFDKKVFALDEKSLKEILDEIKEAALKHAKMTRIIAEACNGKTSIENSEGLDCSYESTLLSIYVEAMNDDGFGFAAFQSRYMPTDDEIAELGTNAGIMAKTMKGAKKLEAGKYTVVFSPEAFKQMLAILVHSLSGDWKRRKISRLYNMQGKRVFDKKFSLYEKPKAKASNIRPFDDEGVPSRELELIRNGVVKNFMYNREIAALANIPSNRCGCCVRATYDAFPGIAPSNLVIEGGEYNSFEEELRNCLFVHSIHGTHTANLTTGDFGVEVNVAFYLENGRKMPKKGFLITGNVFSLFSSIYDIEKKAITYDNLISPRIAFRDVQVV